MRTFREFLVCDGVLSLPDETQRFVDRLMSQIQQACVPAYWQQGFAVLVNNQEFGFQFNDTAVIVKPMSFDEVVSDFQRLGSINLANYAVSPQPHVIIKVFFGYDENVEVHKKVIPEIFKIEEIQSKIEHEFIHSIDPTSSMTLNKAQEDPEQLNKFSKEYRASPYTARGIGTGNIPIEFNPYMWEVLRSARNAPPDEIRSFMKHPDGNLPSFLEKHRQFIQSVLQKPYLRKVFLTKLSQAV